MKGMKEKFEFKILTTSQKETFDILERVAFMI